jgi:hypothetical protein
MTALLTDNEIDYAQRLAEIKPKFVGTMSNGEGIYFNGRYSIEKDRQYLVEPTDAEFAEIYRLVRPEPDNPAPARGIVIGLLVGCALWLVVAIILWSLLEAL